jgi:hypothetical protein
VTSNEYSRSVRHGIFWPAELYNSLLKKGCTAWNWLAKKCADDNEVGSSNVYL